MAGRSETVHSGGESRGGGGNSRKEPIGKEPVSEGVGGAKGKAGGEAIGTGSEKGGVELMRKGGERERVELKDFGVGRDTEGVDVRA